jgi:peptidyl-prolyl cis-trans isomerase C
MMPAAIFSGGAGRRRKIHSIHGPSAGRVATIRRLGTFFPAGIVEAFAEPVDTKERCRMKRLTYLATLVLAAVLLSGCGSKSPEDILVAKVNDRQISLDLYQRAWRSVDARYLPQTRDLDCRREFLQTMINKEVLALKADELGYEKDAYVQKGMETFKKVGLTMGYLKMKVADKIHVTDDDVKAAYPYFGKTLAVKQILVDTKAEADEVVSLIRGGADFETTCKKYSKGPDAEEGGKVVTAVWGQFQPHFQEELFSRHAGEITDPILSQYGYFVIKVIKENPGTNKPLEEVKDDVHKILKQQAEMRETAKMSQAIRDKHNFQFYEDNLVIAFDALPPDRPLTNPPNRSEEVYPLLRYDPRDLDKPLLTYDDKTITIKDFSDLYDRAAFFKRPRRQFRLGDMRKFLTEIVMNDLITIELEETGVENEPEVARWLKSKKEQFMVDKLYQDLVDGQTELTDNEIKQYYDDNTEQFRRPEERRFTAIVAGDRAAASKARSELIAGRNAEAVRKEFSMPDEAQNLGLNDRFFAKGQQAEVDAHGFDLARVGDVSDVFESPDGWTVLKLVERRPDRILPYDEAKEDIKHMLKSIRNEERLNELLTKWKGEYNIEIYEKNLMKADLKRGTPGVSFG